MRDKRSSIRSYIILYAQQNEEAPLHKAQVDKVPLTQALLHEALEQERDS